MITKSRHGYDILLGDGEGCMNLKRHELEELVVDITNILLNEDIGDGKICSK